MWAEVFHHLFIAFAGCSSHDLFDASNYLRGTFLTTWRLGERKKGIIVFYEIFIIIMIATLLFQLPIRETPHASPRCRREYPYFPSALFLSHDALRGENKSCISHFPHPPPALRLTSPPEEMSGDVQADQNAIKERATMYNPGTRLSRGPGDPGPGPGSPPISRVGYSGPVFEAGVQL